MSTATQMWREETGVLEMFLAYYSQFEENVTEKKAYSDFLTEIIGAHEWSLTLQLSAAVPSSGESDFPLPSSAWKSGADRSNSSGERESCESLGQMPGRNLLSEAASCLVEVKREMEEEGEQERVVCGGAEQRHNTYYLPAPDCKLASSTSLLGTANSNADDRKPASDSFDESDPSSLPSVASSSSTLGLGPTEQCLPRPQKPVIHAVTSGADQWTTDAQNNRLPAVPSFACSVQPNEPNHRPPRKTHSCRFCTKSFVSISHLRVHERIHTGARPYECRFCEKNFNQLPNLRRHERIHTGERPYECRVCMKTFIQSGNLHTHERTHQLLSD